MTLLSWRTSLRRCHLITGNSTCNLNSIRTTAALSKTWASSSLFPSLSLSLSSSSSSLLLLLSKGKFRTTKVMIKMKTTETATKTTTTRAMSSQSSQQRTSQQGSSSSSTSLFNIFVSAAASTAVAVITWTARNKNVDQTNASSSLLKNVFNHNVTYCEESNPQLQQNISENYEQQTQKLLDGMDHNAGDDLYHGFFPNRQLFRPINEYPLWNSNWDNLEPISTGNVEEDKKRARRIRKDGVTRHIILIRHGQYDETHKDDTKRILTPLGIEQAHVTGHRIASLIQSIVRLEDNDNLISNPQSSEDSSSITEVTNDTNEHSINIIKIHVSQLTRAKQTADIISSYLPTSIQYDSHGNSDLNEGRPCHTIPSQIPVPRKVIEITDIQHPKIENAFRTYFCRHHTGTASPQIATTTYPSSSDSHNDHIVSSPPATIEPSATSVLVTSENEKHEFEIIVCHANVIRYFLCRALQLPPEAWLRFCFFNCSLTYLTIRPSGNVSCRTAGDIGHLPYRLCTFSQHHGFNW